MGLATIFLALENPMGELWGIPPKPPPTSHRCLVFGAVLQYNFFTEMVRISIAHPCVMSICRRSRNVAKNKLRRYAPTQTTEFGLTAIGQFNGTLLTDMLPLRCLFIGRIVAELFLRSSAELTNILYSLCYAWGP